MSAISHVLFVGMVSKTALYLAYANGFGLQPVQPLTAAPGRPTYSHDYLVELRLVQGDSDQRILPHKQHTTGKHGYKGKEDRGEESGTEFGGEAAGHPYLPLAHQTSDHCGTRPRNFPHYSGTIRIIDKPVSFASLRIQTFTWMILTSFALTEHGSQSGAGFAWLSTTSGQQTLQ